jgi:uncharacterized membrane protein
VQERSHAFTRFTPSRNHGPLLATPRDMEVEIPAPGGAVPDRLADLAEATKDEGSDRRQRRLIVNRAFRAIKAQRAAERSWIEAIADLLNGFASSTAFLVLHAIWFSVWILWNTGMLGLRTFDPYPFGLLTMVVSLEAIVLSIFVLMAQKRESAIAELREEMSLQVALRLEEEVTKTLQLVAGLYTRLGHRVAEDPELHEMLQPLNVEAIERELVLQIETAAQMKKMRGRP